MFSEKALRGYNSRMERYRRQFLDQMETLKGTQVNVVKGFNLFSFDVMGDLAYGSSFRMLETSKEHWAIKLLNEGMEPIAFMFPPWFFRILTAIPGLSRDWWRFIRYCGDRMGQRREV